MNPEIGFRCTVCRVRPGEPSSEGPYDPDLALCLECEADIEAAIHAADPTLAPHQTNISAFTAEWRRRERLGQ